MQVRTSLWSAGAVLAGAIALAAALSLFGYGGERLTSKPQDNPRGLVSVTFDDGWESVYDNAVPVLEDAGFLSTHYIATAPWKDAYDPNYMTQAQVRELSRQGHEIGPHGQSHQSLTGLSEEAVRREIANSKADLERAGIFSATFAYPYGEYSNPVVAAVKENGFTGAVTAWQDMNMRTADPYILKRFPITNTTTLDDVKARIDQAIQDDAWTILMFHQIDDSGRDYAVTPELFLEIVKYLQGTGIRVVTVGEGVNMFLE